MENIFTKLHNIWKCSVIVVRGAEAIRLYVSYFISNKVLKVEIVSHT